VNEDDLLRYALTGFFEIIFALPILIFWKRRWALRFGVVVVFVAACAACWIGFDLSKSADTQMSMIYMTLLPVLACGAFVGIAELLIRRKRKMERRRRRRTHQPHHQDHDPDHGHHRHRRGSARA
jgi:peptidoglycan/LPS O-acetylase OafA/YrhL